MNIGTWEGAAALSPVCNLDCWIILDTATFVHCRHWGWFFDPVASIHSAQGAAYALTCCVTVAIRYMISTALASFLSFFGLCDVLFVARLGDDRRLLGPSVRTVAARPAARSRIGSVDCPSYRSGRKSRASVSALVPAAGADAHSRIYTRRAPGGRHQLSRHIGVSSDPGDGRCCATTAACSCCHQTVEAES